MTWYTHRRQLQQPRHRRQATPDTTLTFDKHLPPSGSPVTIWIVAQDERGGTNVVQRQLTFE